MTKIEDDMVKEEVFMSNSHGAHSRIRSAENFDVIESMGVLDIELYKSYKPSLSKIGFYVYALCEIDGHIRIPFYIGKGQGDRCLQHLSEINNTHKVKKIQQLISEKKFGIDILRHNIDSDKSAKLIEATCIDLLGVGNLTNAVRGSGSLMGRMSLEEIHNLNEAIEKEVEPEHAGIAVLLNKTYKSGMSELELFEVTRGIWANPPKDPAIKYAYATYGGIVKEVYLIHSWVKAGTQQYFTRDDLDTREERRRFEFIGRKASEEVREKYVGKLIKKNRGYGSPLIKVGFPENTEEPESTKK